VFSVANSIFRRRTLVLLALVVISIIAGKVGHIGLGFWEGPR
jgi:cation transporter-like permease